MINEYSKALFELTNEKNLEYVVESFDIFMSNFKEDFKKILLSPKISKMEKKNVVKKCFESCDNVFINFLQVIIDNSRTDMLEIIYKDFNYLYDESIDLVHIDVYSVELLDNETHEELKLNLTNKFKNKTIVLDNHIDNTLVGGFKIFYKGKQIDVTLKNQLDMLRANL